MDLNGTVSDLPNCCGRCSHWHRNELNRANPIIPKPGEALGECRESRPACTILVVQGPQGVQIAGQVSQYPQLQFQFPVCSKFKPIALRISE